MLIIETTMQYRRHPIGDYMLGYVRRFNALCSNEPKAHVLTNLYLNKIVTVKAYWASDGIVIFYFPEDPTGQDQAGVYLYDRQSESLSRVVQSYSANLLKITPAPSERLRADLSNLPTLPCDLEQSEIRAGYLNPEIPLKDWEGKIPVTGIAVAPTRHFEDGLLVRALESRVHLWSPTIRTPSKMEIRQYRWLAADFLWYDVDKLSEKFGEEVASADLHVLRLGEEAGLGPEALAHDPFGSVSRHLLKVCREFEELIDRDAVDETEVQRFLEMPAHQFLVSPVHRLVCPQRRIGRFVIDFAVHRADGEWEFVEIEAPRKPIYQKMGEEPSAHLTHAINQIEDCLRYVDDNRQTVEREYGFSGIYRPSGRVVAGRDSDLGEQARRRFMFKRAESPRIELQTYDLLLLEARSYAQGLATMGKNIVREET